jgi:hypothetical protein
MDLFPNERLPLIPESTLRAHKVHEPFDTRFRASARLLQALWRERAGLTMGAYVARGRRKKLGSRLAALPAMSGGNFLAEEIRHLARRELAYREPGAMIDEARVWGNLLSSMPLAFNLFGPLKLNPKRAARFVAALVPEFAGKIAHIAFEHSPARGDLAFTADATAFDALIVIRRDDGSKVFLAFEVKYSEGMTEPEPRYRQRYDELSSSCGLFIDAEAQELRRNPLQQLWREHMLAHTLVDNGLYDDGRFIVLAPKLNNDVQRAAIAYRKHLAASPSAVSFLNITLEEAADALRATGEVEYARAFVERYLDFGPVHALI